MSKRSARGLKTVILHVVIAVFALGFAFPLLWMLMTSFKTPREYYSMPPKLLPNQLTFFHYKEAFAPWTINPNELSEETYYIEESAGRVESVVPNIYNSLIIIGGSVCAITDTLHAANASAKSERNSVRCEFMTRSRRRSARWTQIQHRCAPLPHVR